VALKRMVNKIIIWCFVGVSLLYSQNLPPPKYSYTNEINQAKPTLRERPAAIFLLGKYPIYFEKTTLQQILDTMKVGQITQQGDAGYDIYWLCYTDPNPNSPQRLWIISDAEMACEKHCVTYVIVQSIKEKSISIKGSPKLPHAFRSALFYNGVHIGVTKVELINILGQPSASTKDWLKFHYEGKIPHENYDSTKVQSEMGESTECNSLVVKVLDGKIVVLYASKITAD
jgi:hypothetical protein